MRDDTAPTGRGKKILTVILIAANLLMLVVGIITIPPNMQRSAEKTGAPLAPPVAAQVPLSTGERPDLEDFLWYTEDVFYDGVPTDAVFIENFGVITGGWKGLIIYDPDNAYGANALEFLNVSIAGKADNLSLTLDWYLMFIAGVESSFDETDIKDAVFEGEWKEGGLWASGTGTIRLTQLYELNDKQYAVGTMETHAGIPALIALVRP